MAVKTKEQVIYSEIESTVHVNEGDVEVFPDGSVHQPHSSRVVLPGETLALDEVPSYMLELIKDKKTPGLVILDRSEADRLNEFAKLARGEAKVMDFVTKSEPEELDLSL